MTKTLLMFFLDAVRYDYLDPTSAPYMHELALNGISAPMKTILGFDGIAPTIATGTYPDRHGSWTQYLRSTRSDCPFRWMTPVSPILDWIDRGCGSRTLRKALRLSTLAASMLASGQGQYPGTHEVPYRLLPYFAFSLKQKIYANKPFLVPTAFDLLRENGFSFQAVDRSGIGRDRAAVAKALRGLKKSDVVYVRLMDLDEITHIYGVGSPEQVRTMRETDHAVKAIVERYSEVDPDPVVMVFADHGMINVQRTVAIEDILLQAGLNQPNDYLGFFDSTMARFWGDEKVLDKIAYVLGNNGSGRILTEHDRRNFHIPEARYGQLIYLIRPGTVIFPSYYARYSCPKAMHGYDPSTDGQNTIFILYHPSFSGKQLRSANLVDIAPTILDLFDVKAPNNLEGHSLLR